MDKSLTFQKFIKEKRLEKNLGLRELARLIGLQPSNYCSSIEAGSLPAPHEDKLRLIAKALKLSKEEQRVLFDLAAQKVGEGV